MKPRRIALALVMAFSGAVVLAAPSSAAPGEATSGYIHYMNAKNAKPGGGTVSPQMTWHAGGILTSTVVQAIFWGPKWSTTSFQGDKVTGLDTLYGGVSNTSYMKTNTEYTGTNGQVGAGVTYGGHVMDLTSTPRRAPSTSTVLATVAHDIANPVPNGYYPVYTDIPRGSAGYCAWHSWGTIGTVNVQFGFFFDLTGDPGCDPADTSGFHSQALAALANVTGHELSETATDPRGAGWFDSKGAENADKCAWTFHKSVTLANGSAWKIQGNWSNAAYANNKSGYANGGCIDGNN